MFWIFLGKLMALMVLSFLWGLLSVLIEKGRKAGSQFAEVLNTGYIVLTLLAVGYTILSLIGII